MSPIKSFRPRSRNIGSVQGLRPGLLNAAPLGLKPWLRGEASLSTQTSFIDGYRGPFPAETRNTKHETRNTKHELMTMPVRSLPVLQNWDCSVCGACCRAYHVHVTPAEQARIEGQGWESDPDLAGVPYFVKESGLLSGGGYRLNHRPDGTCVFLGPDNRCRIHGKFGSAAKPLACRIYPFVFIPAGDHWRVGMRFACPNVAGNKGRPVADQLADAREYVAAVEADSPAAVNGPPIPLAAGRVVPWADVYRIVAAVSKLLANTTVPLERRWRTVLGLVGLCRGLKFDGDGDPKKAVTGGRLAEMLHLLGQAAAIGVA